MIFKFKFIIFLLSLFSFFPAHSGIVLGPFSKGTRCPVGTENTSGGMIYCKFRDPNIVQAGKGRCPSGLKGAETRFVGRDTWCVVRKLKSVR